MMCSNSNIDNQLKALHEQRSAMGNEINGLTQNLALLNQKIVQAESTGADSSALRDHRESLVGEVFEDLDRLLNPTGYQARLLFPGDDAQLLQAKRWPSWAPVAVGKARWCNCCSGCIRPPLAT